MKHALETLLAAALDTLRQDGLLPADFQPTLQFERTRDPAHGDWASNIALMSAKAAGKPPRVIAQAIIDALPANDAISRVELAGPGFINFFLNAGSRFAAIEHILKDAQAYGSPNIGNGQRVLLEYVSANPTGPMHVGHGRGAAYGSALASLLRATGYVVDTEYYVNDAGRQTDVLAVSVYLRYLGALGETVAIPSRAYPAEYIIECAQALVARDGRAYFLPYAELMTGVLPDSADDGDEAKAIKEAHIDSLIARVQEVLGAGYRTLQDFALDTQLAAIKTTLAAFNVSFDAWFSERSLAESGAIDLAISRLRERGHVYDKNGALWLRTSALGDEKDRCMVRDNGVHTYFAADVAYHLNKLDRGYDVLIDVWGADHHGYIARVRAAIEALTGEGDKFVVALIQFVTLSSGRMGKRSGNFVTLSQLIEEAGNDATRFFYLSRAPEQHLEFDIDLARSQSAENPVYYLQYAHARIASIFRECATRDLSFDAAAGLSALPSLADAGLTELVKRLDAWPDAVANAARQQAPHQLAFALRELAQEFHSYYNTNKMLVDDSSLRHARLTVSLAVQKVLAHGLGLLGVAAPERM